jgi:hypothetical protein
MRREGVSQSVTGHFSKIVGTVLVFWHEEDTGQCHQMTHERKGFKNWSKKCHVVFERDLIVYDEIFLIIVLFVYLFIYLFIDT